MLPCKLAVDNNEVLHTTRVFRHARLANSDIACGIKWNYWLFERILYGHFVSVELFLACVMIRFVNKQYYWPSSSWHDQHVSPSTSQASYSPGWGDHCSPAHCAITTTIWTVACEEKVEPRRCTITTTTCCLNTTIGRSLWHAHESPKYDVESVCLLK